MMNLPDDRDALFDRIHDLMVAHANGELTREDFAHFDQLLAESETARQLYVEYIYESLELPLLLEIEEEEHHDALDRGLFQSSAARADALTPDADSPSPPLLIDGVSPLHGRAEYFATWPAAYLIAAVIVGIGLVIAALTHVSKPTHIAGGSLPLPPSSVPAKMQNIGHITGTVDCRWERKVASGQWLVASEERGARDSGLGTRESPNPSLTTNHYPLSTPHKSLVFLGDRFVVSAGLMEITYNSGAKVILQGPCTFEADSPNGGFLTVGKLTARVGQSTKYGVRSTERVASGEWRVASKEPGARGSGLGTRKSSNPSLTTNHYPLTTNSNPPPPAPHPSPLFAVRTPTATVTDLGTEFGVEVDKIGNTTSLVFQGSVRVQTIDADGKAQSDVRVLRENESARVERRDGANPIVTLHAFASSQARGFTRELPKPTVKIFDLVDVVAGGDGFTGKRNAGIHPLTGMATDVPPKNLSEFQIESDGQYHRVKTLPFVDGIFVPDSRTAATQVDSAGHLFKDFVTSIGMTGHHVWAGGKIPSCQSDGRNLLIRTDLGSVDYASDGHGVLFLHSNLGITFDLDAIRRANPDYRLVRFRAAAGNTESDSEQKNEWHRADLWILVDGVDRYKRREINRSNGVFSISLPLAENDRFLTLVSADSGDGIAMDWIAFGDPCVELAPTKPAAGSDPPREEVH